jgi:hypothetical protein
MICGIILQYTNKHIDDLFGKTIIEFKLRNLNLNKEKKNGKNHSNW